MGRIVAIGGGDLETTRKINRFMVELSEKEHPNVLFIGTASHDAEEYIVRIEDAFHFLGCEVKALCLVTGEYTEQEAEKLLKWADIVYVGGGDTAFMITKWKECWISIILWSVPIIT